MVYINNRSHIRDENSKRKSMMELPEQIIGYEIFTRIPTKSLVRCKSVCKTWLSLLSDPKFAKEHCDLRARQNPNEYDCLVACKSSARLVTLSRREETCILSPDGCNLTKLYGSINGLICLCHENKLWIWNPAIHQCKEFTSPSPQIGWKAYHWDNFGFGFDCVGNDYKVVALNNSCDRMWSAFLYSSNSDKWSHLIVPDSVFPSDYVCSTKRGRIQYRLAAIVKDCPYWTLYYRHCSDEFVALNVMKFETGSNKFKLLPEFRCKSGEDTKLMNMMDRPTLMDYEQDSGNICVDVYSLDEKESGVWSKMYSVGPIANYGLKPKLSQCFKYGGGTIVFYKDGVFSYYDHKTDTISLIQGKISYDIASCYRYTPSLVFLKGMKSDTPLVSINHFMT